MTYFVIRRFALVFVALVCVTWVFVKLEFVKLVCVTLVFVKLVFVAWIWELVALAWEFAARTWFGTVGVELVGVVEMRMDVIGVVAVAFVEEVVGQRNKDCTQKAAYVRTGVGKGGCCGEEEGHSRVARFYL
jgi:hypothetical protein